MVRKTDQTLVATTQRSALTDQECNGILQRVGAWHQTRVVPRYITACPLNVVQGRLFCCIGEQEKGKEKRYE